MLTIWVITLISWPLKLVMLTTLSHECRHDACNYMQCLFVAHSFIMVSSTGAWSSFLPFCRLSLKSNGRSPLTLSVCNAVVCIAALLLLRWSNSMYCCYIKLDQCNEEKEMRLWSKPVPDDVARYLHNLESFTPIFQLFQLPTSNSLSLELQRAT